MAGWAGGGADLASAGVWAPPSTPINARHGSPPHVNRETARRHQSQANNSTPLHKPTERHHHKASRAASASSPTPAAYTPRNWAVLAAPTFNVVSHRASSRQSGRVAVLILPPTQPVVRPHEHQQAEGPTWLAG